MDRSNPQHLLSRLHAAGIRSKKALGQHFLVDRSVLDRILETAQLSREDTVVEIGPGPGVLTEELLKKAGRVLAFEYDPEMARILRTDFPELELIEGDVLQTAPRQIPGLSRYKLVANIPYQITTPLLRLFLEGEIQPLPESLTLLVQKEVGERLTAGPKQKGRGYLSILCQFFARTEYICTVKAGAFLPPPQVDSALISLRRREERPLPDARIDSFLRFVHSLFIQPRKQLKNVMAGRYRVAPAEVADYLREQALPERVRAEELSNEEWLKLYLNPYGE